MAAQSRGWPFIFFAWALWDFALLYGDRKFVHHWAYWQDSVGLMNNKNPSGDVTSNELYLKVLVSVMVVSMAVTVKRAIIGRIVGKRIVHSYRKDLALLMRKLTLMCEVSQWSVRTNEKNGAKKSQVASASGDFTVNHRPISQDLGFVPDDDVSKGGQQMDSFDYSDAQSAHSKETRKLFASEKMEIIDLLDAWEEPVVPTIEESVSSSACKSF